MKPPAFARLPPLLIALPACLAISPEWPKVVFAVWLLSPFWALAWLDVRARWHSERR